MVKKPKFEVPDIRQAKLVEWDDCIKVLEKAQRNYLKMQATNILGIINKLEFAERKAHIKDMQFKNDVIRKRYDIRRDMEPKELNKLPMYMRLQRKRIIEETEKMKAFQKQKLEELK